MNKTLPCLLGGALLASCTPSPPDPGPRSPGPAVTTSASAEAPPLDPPALRLPGDAAAARYRVDLTIDPALPTFTGTVSIDLEVRKPVRVVWLHAQDLTVRGASFTAAVGAVPSPAPAKVIAGKQPFVGFVLPVEVLPGKPGVLAIDYEGKIDGERPQGVYAVSEGGGQDDRYVYTLFEPLDARRAFPCFDEPEYKVPWQLSIKVKKGHGAFSNAEAASETEEGDWKRISFAETPPLPSYLVAFMAGPFDVVDAGTVGREKKKLRFIVPKGRGAETGYASRVTPAIVGHLEDYFGMPYPYSKLDVAVVPRYEGTMEHAGIVALGQPLTLIKPEDESLFRKKFYVNIAAHELAHFWFGDYVTMKWWDDTWLNESFAQWMDAKITDAVEPSWGALRSERLERAAAAMSADRLASAKKMRQPVESVEDILHSFDASLTYNKGSSVITMMEHAVGPDKWQAVVRRYMQKLAWKTADTADFVAVLAEMAGRETAAAFETFLNQPGVPLVTVTPVCGAGAPRLRLEQERFSPLGAAAGAAAPTWSVPVCVRYGAGKDKGRTCFFLGEKTKEIAVPDLKACPDWVVPNEGGTGYYISKYSAASIDQIRGKGKSELAPEERAALVRDVGLLVSNGTVPLGKAMELVPDAVAADDKTTLQAAQSIFENVRAADLPEPLVEKFRSFARKTFSPRAKALGFTPKPGEGPGQVEMRAMLLFGAGLAGEDPEILEKAKGLTLKWLDDRKSLSPDVASVVLGLGARSNDKALFDKLAARAKAAPDRNEKLLIFPALGKVTDKALAERALELVLAKDLDLHETFPIVESLLHGRQTRDLAYAFLEKSFDAILGRMSGFEKPFVFALPAVYCDAGHRARAEAFFGPRAKAVEGAERVLATALESISVCEATFKSALPSLEAFLRKY
jgi:aminopeptidase N